MAKLTKTQTYAILWLNNQNRTSDEISLELNIEEKLITPVLEKHHKASENPNIKTKSSVVGDKTKNLMIMETAVKKNKSVAIMTKDASTLGDENRKQIPARSTNRNIFRPKG